MTDVIIPRERRYTTSDLLVLAVASLVTLVWSSCLGWGLFQAVAWLCDVSGPLQHALAGMIHHLPRS
jgi:hypothetical protein